MTARQNIDTRRFRELRKVGQQRPGHLRTERLAAKQGEEAANHAVVHRQLELGVARFGVEAAETRGHGLGHGTVSRPGFLQTPRQDQRQATGQRQPRARLDDVLAQPPVGGLELDQPLAEPQAKGAGALQDIARQGRFPRFDGVAHGGRRFASPHKGPGNPPMDGCETAAGVSRKRRLVQCSRINGCSRQMSLAPSRTGSSSPTRTGIVPIRRIESLRSNTLSRSAASIHSNNPISSRNSRSSAPSPAKSRDSTQFSTNSCAAPVVPPLAALDLVAGNPERERPTGRLGHQRGQPRARQFPVEEVGDLRFREPQFLCRHDRGAAFQHGAGDVHAGGELPARKRQVQVGRAAL